VLAYRTIVAPVLDEYAPELVIVSAGYDAHERDPLASMRMSAAGYGAIVRIVRDAALAHGQLALATEGGYDLPAMRESLEASLSAIDRSEYALPAFGGAAARGERAVAAVRAAVEPFWRAI
jgi:acetoin utilization deacetylase AcuC-like enzyme